MRLPRNRKYRLIVTTGLIVTLIGLSRVAVPVHWFTPQYPWTSRGVRSQLPDVLLIGDSTEMRYATYVLDALDGVANVYSLWEYDSQRLHSLFIGGPLIRPVNASSTHNGLRHLDEWLDGRTWDVIHFNWGLHDLASPAQGEPEAQQLERVASEYASRLDSLATRLIKSEASLIFATTTPVPDGDRFIPPQCGYPGTRRTRSRCGDPRPPRTTAAHTAHRERA